MMNNLVSKWDISISTFNYCLNIFLISGGIPDSLASAKVLLQDWNKYDSFVIVYLFVYSLP